MSYEVKILMDSIAQGVRLTTVAATYPRIIHSELMTHRMLSRNAASSRAIPVEKNIDRVLKDPFIPEVFHANVKGMQGGEALDPGLQQAAWDAWTDAIDDATRHAARLAKIGVHKQWANRLLEPYSWITTIITATEWENFFALRCHKDAAPEFQKIAGMIRDAMGGSTPTQLDPGDWHLPFVEIVLDRPRIYKLDGIETAAHAIPVDCADSDVRRIINEAFEPYVKVSVARCARVSYLTHDGKRDVAADLALYDKLVNASPRHLSPCEHAARVVLGESRGRRDEPAFYGNFRAPWEQHRKQIDGEAVFHG